MVDKELIDKIIINDGFAGFSNAYSSAELESHRKNIGPSILKQTLDSDDILTKYLLSSHLLTKLKHAEPNQKVIDAYDIDWDGYKVSIRGQEFKPKTTFETLDLIFSLISQLYDYHGSDYVSWNDAGFIRTDNNQLYWYAGTNMNHADEDTYKEISNIYSNENCEWNIDYNDEQS